MGFQRRMEKWYEGKLLDDYIRKQDVRLFRWFDVVLAGGCHFRAGRYVQSDGYDCSLLVSTDIFPNDRHIQNTRGSSGNWENEEVRRRTRISLAKIERDDV